MSITSTNDTASTLVGSHTHQRVARERFERLNVGQTVTLKVERRLDAERVLAELDGAQHIVETAMALTAGATFRATVAAVGDKLELKYLDTVSVGAAKIAVPVAASPTNQGEAASRLEALQGEYAVTLDPDARRALLAAMRAAADPEQMAKSGLFLGKLQEQIDGASLQAVYGALSWLQPSSPADKRASVDATKLTNAVESGDPAAATDVGAELEKALRLNLDAASAAGISTQSSGGDSEQDARDRAHRLLNTPDDGSVAYAFGRIPLLIADQLLELDVVLMGDRRAPPGHENAMRRLVMSLQTPALGKVEIMAQAVGDRLTIALTADSVAASSTLSSYADDVRKLVTKLGWNVDSIRYDIDARRGRAAEHVVQHVLNAGTVDRMF